MARQARQRCDNGVYHIVMRGINRQDIFYDEDDYQRFMGTLERLKTDKFEVYGYCLMSNHVHLLIHEKSEEIPQIMKRIGTSYAWWYNRKYQRTGHVFQGRYGSECVEDDEYLLTVISLRVKSFHNNNLFYRQQQSEEFPARFGRTGFRRNFPFDSEWRGRYY
jgi:REP element-mobilizing transposase RayT